MVSFGENNKYGDIAIIGVFMSSVSAMLGYTSHTILGTEFSDVVTTVMSVDVELFSILMFISFAAAYILNKPLVKAYNNEQKALVVFTGASIVLTAVSPSFLEFATSQNWVALTFFGLMGGGIWTLMAGQA